MADVNRAWKELSSDARKNYITTNAFVLDDDNELAPFKQVEQNERHVGILAPIENLPKRPRLEPLKKPVRKPEAQLIEIDENGENSISNHQVFFKCILL